MKRSSFLNILLELIVLFGHLILGVTIVTFLLHHEAISRVFIGLVVTATGMIEITEFFTYKITTKMKSMQNLIAAICMVILGVVFVIVRMDTKILCIILGIACTAFAITRIITAVLNMMRQPLINAVRVILNITMIVLNIFLIVKTIDFLASFTTFIGIAMCIEALILLIEFLIHRYQN